MDGSEYQAPAEAAIQTFFSIGEETLYQIEGYQPDTDSYVYQTRSFTALPTAPTRRICFPPE